MKNLIKQNLKQIKPYTCARQLYSQGIFFDANENDFGSVTKIPGCNNLNRYPDPNCKKLTLALSTYLKVKTKNIIIGNGSDEIISLLTQLVINPNDEVIIIEPSYGMYRVASEISGATIKTSLLTDSWQLDVNDIRNKISNKTKIIFMCSPNNPTGNLLKKTNIEIICKSTKAIIVLDEAYIEFSSRPSLIKLTDKFQNLIILRTLSKAWGLAGIRIGYGIAQEELINYLKKIKLPYNVNRLSCEIATQALGQAQKMAKLKTQMQQEKIVINNTLTKLGCRVFPSETNFLLVQNSNCNKIVDILAKRYKLIVRNMSDKPKLKNCFRITIGTPKCNQKLLKALKEIL